MAATYCEIIISMFSSNLDQISHTERDTIVSKSFDLLQNIRPKINDRKPPWMELSSVKEDTLAAYEQ